MYVFTDSTLKYLLKKIKSKIALKSELDNKVDKVDGKGLSDNDFTDSAKSLLETKFTSVEASYSTGMTHIKFSNENESNTKTIDLKTGCDMFFYPSIDAELLADLEGNVTIPYAFISKSGNDIGKVTANIKNLTNNISSENVFNVTDNGGELILTGASSGNANVSFTIEGNTEELKANVLGEYSTVIILPLTVYRSTDSSLVPSNVSNTKTVVSDFGSDEYEIMLYADTSTNYLNFYNVQTLTNVSYISDSITNMYQTYSNCRNLTGSPVCGDNVTNMYGAYFRCTNLTGNPVCGENVTNMSCAYTSCVNLTGPAVCGDKVTNMASAYSDCPKLKSPACGSLVTNMVSTYYGSENMKGSPVCGPNVTNMHQTYYLCSSLTGNPVCGDKVVNFRNAYYNCSGLTGNPACGDEVNDMYRTYSGCKKLTGSPVCRNNVTNMQLTYFDCVRLTGTPACGPNVTDMSHTYYNCFNLTGSPVCGDNVTNMGSAYRYCYNLTGSPVCGNNVTNMTFTYYYCSNLTGSPVYGNNVINMASTYAGCINLTGSSVCGNNVTNMTYTYSNCKSLGHNGYFFSNKISNACGCFAGRNTQNRLNLYVPNTGPNSTYNTLRWCLASNTHSLLANNASWTDNMTVNGCYYNTAYNIYIYPINNVAQTYKENELLVARYTINNTSSIEPEVRGIEEVRVLRDETITIEMESFDDLVTVMDGGTDLLKNTSFSSYDYTNDEYYLSSNGIIGVHINRIGDVWEITGYDHSAEVAALSTNANEMDIIITYIIPCSITSESIDNGSGTKTVSIYSTEEGVNPIKINFNGMTDLLSVEKLRTENITNGTNMFKDCSNFKGFEIDNSQYYDLIDVEGDDSGSLGSDVSIPCNSKAEAEELIPKLKVIAPDGSSSTFSIRTSDYEEGFYGSSDGWYIDAIASCGGLTIVAEYEYGIWVHFDAVSGTYDAHFTVVVEDKEIFSPDFSNIENTTSMFEGCSSLEYLDTSGFNTLKTEIYSTDFTDFVVTESESKSMGQFDGIEDVEIYSAGFQTKYPFIDKIVTEGVNDIYKFESSEGYFINVVVYPDGQVTIRTTADDDSEVLCLRIYSVIAKNICAIECADYMFAGCSKLTKESFESSSYVYDLKYESDTYTLNYDEKIKLFDYPSSEFNFITLNLPITEYVEGQSAFEPQIERNDMYECTYYTFGRIEPIVITVYDNGSVYAYSSDGPAGDITLYLYNKHKYTFELPNVESASHIFDGCTNLQ